VTLTPAAGGPTLNARLVAGGHAWHYTRYSDDVELAEAERTARAARAGLWQAETPQPPWDYRKAKRTREAEGASD
jgi:micrococcal nuclease